MKSNIKLINIATVLNNFGDLLLVGGGYALFFYSIEYVHTFNLAVKNAKKELVYDKEILSSEEFNEIEKRSRMKIREELFNLYFGDYGKNFYYNYRLDSQKWHRIKDLIKDLKILGDIEKL